jgi:hypothetical protein
LAKNEYCLLCLLPVLPVVVYFFAIRKQPVHFPVMYFLLLRKKMRLLLLLKKYRRRANMENRQLVNPCVAAIITMLKAMVVISGWLMFNGPGAMLVALYTRMRSEMLPRFIFSLVLLLPLCFFIENKTGNSHA